MRESDMVVGAIAFVSRSKWRAYCDV